MTAGIKTIEMLSKKSFYVNLENKNKKLINGLCALAKKHNIDFTGNYVGGMFGFFFTKNKKICNFEDVSNCDKILFEKFFKIMLSKGIYFAPSSFEAGFISIKHSDKDINYTLQCADETFKMMSNI